MKTQNKITNDKRKFTAAIITAKLLNKNHEANILLNLFDDLHGPMGKEMENDLKMWVIYKNPKDYPNETVARLHTVQKKATGQILTGDLDSLRQRFDSQGYVNIGRFENDDPCIVEVWI